LAISLRAACFVANCAAISRIRQERKADQHETDNSCLIDTFHREKEAIFYHASIHNGYHAENRSREVKSPLSVNLPNMAVFTMRIQLAQRALSELHLNVHAAQP
jgi:hypothetical protein